MCYIVWVLLLSNGSFINLRTIIIFEKNMVYTSKALFSLVCYVLDDKELLECLRSL